MFLAMLPISKTGGSAVDISAIIHFLYPKLFRHGVLLLATCLLGHKCFQAIHRLNQMQCCPSFDSNWDKQNDPTTCWYQLHPQYQVFQQEKCLSSPPDCVGREEAAPLSNPH